MPLNEQQQQAISHTGSHQLIVAGPGTGKTHTLTQKILYLVQSDAAPHSIIAITFTSKAAQEMKERIEPVLAPQGEGYTPNLPFIGTFHALALHLLKQRGHEFTILLPKKQDEIISEITASKKLNQKQKKELKRIFSLAKNQLMPLNEVETFLDAQLAQELYDRYAQHLEENHLLDFDDLLLKALELLKEETTARPLHLFIDEYQDINELQYRFVKNLIGPDTKVYAIGDPDQSIYAFRGSNIEHFLRFEKDFPSAAQITLTQNYRSTPQILTAASALIANNTQRIQKTVTPTNADGKPVTLHRFEDEWQESKFIAREIARLVGGTTMIDAHHTDFIEAGQFHFSDIAVLYRTKAQARVMEEVFKRNGLPYQCVSSVPWYQKKEIQELLSYLQYLLTPADETNIEEGQKILLHNYVREHRSLADSKPSVLVRTIMAALKLEEHHSDGTPRGVRKAENLQNFLAMTPMFDSHAGEAGLQNLLDHFALLQEEDAYNPQAKAVSLMTLHAGKGLEFPVVFIAGLEDGLVPLRKKDAPPSPEGDWSHMEEERRLLYVGMTRAKSKLYLSYAAQRNKTPATASPFITEIDPHIQKQEMPVRRTHQANNQMSLL